MITGRSQVLYNVFGGSLLLRVWRLLFAVVALVC